MVGKGRTPCCDKNQVKKGPWSPTEDLRLITFIQKNGHANWRALPKQAGLSRCGKSCRLRWINYLRPDVKRGNFTIEEEETIIKLHQSLGNKWSKIASYLSGRTDNEIKNVWNTHLKKRVEAYKLTCSNKIVPEVKDSLLTTCSQSTSQSSTIVDNIDQRIEFITIKRDFDSANEVNSNNQSETNVNITSVPKELFDSPSINSSVTTSSNEVDPQRLDQAGSFSDQFGGEFDDYFVNHENTTEVVYRSEIDDIELQIPFEEPEDFALQIPLEAGYDFWSMFDSLNSFQPNRVQEQNVDCNDKNSTHTEGDQALANHNEVRNKQWLHQIKKESDSDPAKDHKS